MPDVLEDYKSVRAALPPKIKRWHLHGAGLESLEEATVDLPAFGPEQLLVRHDAVGICFSDIKIIAQGPNHPRLQGRDMRHNPVVMGHEVALTVMGVGAELEGLFEIADRFTIQADVYYQGANLAYGYQLAGGMAQYGVITKEVLQGDEGCYLLPLKEDTGYVEAALVEPWACVVAAYEYPNYRDGLKDGGRLLVMNMAADFMRQDAALAKLVVPDHQPINIVTVTPKDAADAAQFDFAALKAEQTDGEGFDDILVLGTPSAEVMGRILTARGKRGILNLILDKPLAGTVPVDVGRVHYEQQLCVGTSDAGQAAVAYTANVRRDIKPGGKVWFVGAGGPMGQMHLQRAIMLDAPPKTIVVSDFSGERLGRVRERFGKLMDGRGIHLVLVNPQKKGEDAVAHGPFDDIVSLVPSAAMIEEAAPHLAENGVLNIFAGLGKGTMAQLDLGTILTKRQRLIGTSGSSIADLRHTLELVESGALSTNASLAAIGGLSAFRDGLAAVKEGRFPGKTVIFPMLPDLPLLSADEIKDQLPTVYEKMQDGLFWTKEAEEELLREKLTPTPPSES